MSMSGWIGVDLDGTLAHYGSWKDGVIGDPIPRMLKRVKEWLADGIEVRIVTARVGTGAGYSTESKRPDDLRFAAEQHMLIQAWCEVHLGQKLAVTAAKDFAMIELWDDRAVQVEMNTGRRIDGSDES